MGNGQVTNEPMMRLSGGQTSFGNIAVYLFFIISGFLITNSFVRSRSVWTYLRKRVALFTRGSSFA